MEIFQYHSVKKAFDRWYMIQAQAYIDARRALRLKEHQASDLTHYCNVLDRKPGMKD